MCGVDIEYYVLRPEDDDDCICKVQNKWPLRCATLAHWCTKFSVSIQMSEPSRKEDSLKAAGRLFQMAGCSGNCKVSGADDSPSFPYQQFRGVGRLQVS